MPICVVAHHVNQSPQGAKQQCHKSHDREAGTVESEEECKRMTGQRYNEQLIQAGDRMSTDNLDKVGQKSNSKIGRPTKTGQEEQFKRCYLDNRKKFELECELLVCIHELFFEEIPTHPVNYRVSVNEIFSLFQTYNCLPIYRTLLDVNELYFKNSSICPDERLRYTSIIDVCYMLKQVKQQLGRFLNCYSLILLVLFFLFNEKVVNRGFMDYFTKNVEVFRNGMVNGPLPGINKVDALIIGLTLEIAIREDIIIEQSVYEQEQEKDVSASTLNSQPLGQQEPRDN